MIGGLLELLAELGLIHLDVNHRKKITKKEKTDGKKRPFQKYFLQPSALMLIGFTVIVVVSTVLFFTYQRTFVYPEKTKNEISKMTNWAEKWKEKYGEYPNDIIEMIGNNPMKQTWKTDAWDRPYKYIKSDTKLLIVSAGSDGKFDTNDDIINE